METARGSVKQDAVDARLADDLSVVGLEIAGTPTFIEDTMAGLLGTSRPADAASSLFANALIALATILDDRRPPSERGILQSKFRQSNEAAFT